MLTQPLEIVTGLPGASKTLHTIQHVEDFRKKTGRPVFYAGINELTLPWEKIDPTKWMETPEGSVIVIDEAQQVFRPSSVNKDPQPWITGLETIRHGGRNMVLVTQQPMLLHSNVRKLAGKHYHIVRHFGSHSATMHEWDGVRENCSKSTGRADSQKHVLRFPKEVFAWYKSAEVHTVKRSIPMRVWVLLALLFVIPAGAWFMWQRMHHPAGIAEQPQVVGANGGVLSGNVSNAPKPVLSYLQQRQPRFAGLPQTAPVYDDVMKPTIAPKPSACAASKSRCSCYTQQGTRIAAMPEVTCRSIVENGYFDDAPDKPVDGGRDRFFDRQARNGALLEAASEPSRVGADEAPLAASPVRRFYVEPRQVVTPTTREPKAAGAPGR